MVEFRKLKAYMFENVPKRFFWDLLARIVPGLPQYRYFKVNDKRIFIEYYDNDLEVHRALEIYYPTYSSAITDNHEVVSGRNTDINNKELYEYILNWLDGAVERESDIREKLVLAVATDDVVEVLNVVKGIIK